MCWHMLISGAIIESSSSYYRETNCDITIYDWVELLPPIIDYYDDITPIDLMDVTHIDFGGRYNKDRYTLQFTAVTWLLVAE